MPCGIRLEIIAVACDAERAAQKFATLDFDLAGSSF
jgi:hypothetical protein